MDVDKNIVTDTIFELFAAEAAGPKYRALAAALRAGIGSGQLPPATRLPPVRDLGWRLGMTPGTVARAYTLLTDEGLLVAEVGRGTFVQGPAGPRPPLLVGAAPEEAAGDGMVSLFTARLPDLGQVALIRSGFARLAERPAPELLDYPSGRAFAPARQVVLDWLREVPLGPVDHEDVVLSHGAQNGISLVMQAVLRGRRPVVLVEDLCYPGFRRAAELLRAELVAVPMDAQGLIPGALADLARRHEAQLLCTSPELHNPTALVTPPERRREIAEVARACGLHVLEDDSTSLGDPRTESYRAMLPDLGWFVSSISKTLTPGLRVGFTIAPQARRGDLRRVAEYGFFGLALPLAELLGDLLARPETREIVRAVRARNGQYVRATVNALGGHDLSWDEQAPFVWLRLPAGWRAAAFCLAAEAQGVQVRAAEEFALRDTFAPHAVRLGMNTRVPMPEFEAALGRLRRLLDDPPGQILV
ncbi:PLP-dependent aminotransferase family protein [Salipiger marinus]|uniref:Transcriptional regulator, GntR family n=1 Tax=Salipiger marinus TaxID=555512 RepID=A0A1G8TN84_9RHOB|nr:MULTISPECIES: PLP-dependent aminotransferase family protein [Salipiger]MCD1619508.1 PLP-dependent aminotransferase family protein [Salipiger manganoxidans]MEB3420342.1 PLP-dependent aminotransferase family protein [Salipiger manganoxidans]SDJ43056.1 transcriptional regulator, GntR family [Salipiger marinus]